MATIIISDNAYEKLESVVIDVNKTNTLGKRWTPENLMEYLIDQHYKTASMDTQGNRRKGYR